MIVREPHRQRYDAAQTTDENSRHWSMADALSADGSANPAVRATLRNRCRYEFANNCMAMGIVNTMAQHVVAGGPTLVCNNSKIESMWMAWAKEVRLNDKLRLIVTTEPVSGESFVFRITNERLQNPIKIDFKISEPDHICGNATYGKPFDSNFYDGIQYDSNGNPVVYYVHETPPNDVMYSPRTEPVPVDAYLVFHDYEAMRPGQRRGVPKLTPALPLFAFKRRWTLATIAGAETAANLAVLLKTPGPVDADAGDRDEDGNPIVRQYAPLQAVDFERNMATIMPDGYDVAQLKPEQPTTNYEMFDGAIVKESARCINMPYTIAALDSSKANMSAAYLDWQTYNAATILPRQQRLGYLLDWIFAAWIREVVLNGLISEEEIPESFKFLWSSVGEHADPSKVAKANEIDLATGVTNLAKIHARRGEDWEEQQDIAARTLGISKQDYQAFLRQRIFNIPQQTSATDSPEGDDGTVTTPPNE